MTDAEFYGAFFNPMLETKQQLLDMIQEYPQDDSQDLKPIIYCCSRIKSAESMIQKLNKQGLPANSQTALTKMFDAIGIRIICSFAEDVYHVVNWLSKRPDIKIISKKDYIAYPKPNGYRSYHLQIKFCKDEEIQLPAEIQVRTIATDFWATLEHQLKYKKELQHEELVRRELKRCADEIASVDLSMQTIKEILREDFEEE